MDNPVLIAACSLLFFLPGKAQNLVPNHSFEDTTFCPVNFADFSLTDWFRPNAATPDNYHSCSTAEMGVPQNFIGYQAAQDGNAYVGTIIYEGGLPWREYFAVQLISTLEAGKTYYWCMWLSLCDNTTHASNNMGIALTNTLVTSSGDYVLNVPVYGNTAGAVTERENWVQIGGSFTANGGENYLYIGNFFDDAHTIPIEDVPSNPLLSSAYYYVDNVYLGEESCGDFSIVIPNIFTPNGDGINDLFYVNENAVIDLVIRVYNRWGRLVFENTDSSAWDGSFEDQPCSEGIYFYTISYLDIMSGPNAQKTGFVQLLR